MKPRIGISLCLLGEEVRHDGGHKRSTVIMKTLSKHFEWVPVCPEVDVGMGVPREPIQLRMDGDQIRLVGVESGRDWTGSMKRYAERRTVELAAQRIDGVILKSGSPSCGIDDVELHHSGATCSRNGVGAFARILRTRLPALPVADERRLEDECARRDFIAQVDAYRERLRRDSVGDSL